MKGLPNFGSRGQLWFEGQNLSVLETAEWDYVSAGDWRVRLCQCWRLVGEIILALKIGVCYYWNWTSTEQIMSNSVKYYRKKGKGYQYCFGENKGKFKSSWSYSSLFQPILVHSSLFQFSPAHSSPFQPIPAYCGIFQIISANSRRQMVLGRCQLVLGIPGDCDIPNLGVQTTKQATPQV